MDETDPKRPLGRSDAVQPWVTTLRNGAQAGSGALSRCKCRSGLVGGESAC